MEYATSTVERLAVHRIGNKLRGDPLRLSQTESPLGDTLSDLILGGYLKGICVEKNEYYFHHETSLSLNEASHYITEFFHGEVDFLETSRRLARHLYENSLHPNIRNGDLLTILFENIIYGNHKRRALGLFKTDILDDFLTIIESNECLTVLPTVGINPNSLDKGALILEGENAVFAVERLGSKTKFWLENFLKVKKLPDDTTAGKVISYIVSTIARKIDDPLDRSHFGNVLGKLCENEDRLGSDALATASQMFVDPETYQKSTREAENRFGLSLNETVTAPTEKIRKVLNRNFSQLPLGRDITLTIPPCLRLAQVSSIEAPNGNLVLTIELEKSHER